MAATDKLVVLDLGTEWREREPWISCARLLSRGDSQMELIDALNALASKVRQQRASIHTEEAAKNAFVMPFLANVLGYDVFDPSEVIPEFIADLGIKKGEKIDYAITRNGDIQILVECKKSLDALRFEHASQLYRYFAVTKARIALLTNGLQYHFFADLDKPNVMDEKPFLVIDLLDIDLAQVPALAKLSRDSFDIDSVLGAAEELKYVGQIKREIAKQFREPEDEWLRFFIARVYSGGSITQKVREQLSPLVVRAGQQFLNDQVNGRLKTALGPEGFVPTESLAPASTSSSKDEGPAETESDVVTTEEEFEGFAIVKAIAVAEVPPSRIVLRDSKTYAAVLLDDNNRKPIARLWLNNQTHKYLGLLDAEKAETRFPINGVEDIYLYADQIREAARRYANK